MMLAWCGWERSERRDLETIQVQPPRFSFLPGRAPTAGAPLLAGLPDASDFWQPLVLLGDDLEHFVADGPDEFGS